MLSTLLGGIGLFLLGMVLMTEGLKAAAGGALRDLLARFTGGPIRAVVSGAALTTMVQSSSATILMTIGFVSAGLLAFTQAIGIIFGAAIGTTSSAWVVAFLGLRFSVSVVALPLVGLGALTHLLGRGRAASIGLTVAGFGLLFVGIDALQAGMNTLSDRFEIHELAGPGIGGRLLLVGIGILMTLVMQSSSAAITTTLAAVHSGTILVPQAAALAIGHTIGTTSTSALAGMSGSVAARRTALAHVFLNSFSGLVALVGFPLYIRLLSLTGEYFGLNGAEQIALFHTAFNVAGVLLLLPITDHFAAFIARLVPDPTPHLTRFLDPSLRSVPAVAVEAVRRTVVQIAESVTGVARGVLDSEIVRRTDREVLRTAAVALQEARTFLSGVRTSPAAENEYRRHLSVLHATDHVERLIETLEDLSDRGWRTAEPELDAATRDAVAGLAPSLAWMASGAGDEGPDLEPLSTSIAARRRSYRTDVMARTASGELQPQDGLRALDTMRWIDRIVYHVWRATHHLAPGGGRPSSDSTGTFGDPPDAGRMEIDRLEREAGERLPFAQP